MILAIKITQNQMEKKEMNIIVSDVNQIIKNVKKELMENLDRVGIDFDEAVFLNPFSGGKDSTASRLIMGEIVGDRLRSTMADTDNENPLTIEYAKTIHEQDGLSPVEIVKANYTEERFEERRAKVKKAWSKKQRIQSGMYKGVLMPSLNDPNSHFNDLWIKSTNETWMKHDFSTPLEACLHHLQRSGNAFLDMMLIHGKPPQRLDRFCTDELKLEAVWNAINEPLIEAGEFVINCSGVRAQESEKRAGYSVFEQDLRDETQSTYSFLPIHKLTHDEVFAVHKHFGVKPNPLYKMGMARVGCMPCVLCNKEELAEIAARFPGEIDRIHEWEKQIRWVSRWAAWMTVPSANQKNLFKRHQKKIVARHQMINNYRPRINRATGKALKAKPIKYVGAGPHAIYGTEKLDLSWDHGVNAVSWSNFLGDRGGVQGGSVHDTIEWSKTGRGGKVYDLVKLALDKDVCSSRYNLCE